jgi:hypothetical protein
MKDKAENTFRDGNTDWLRERADSIRRGCMPESEEELQAFAQGLDMIADAYAKVAQVALEAVAAVDVLTEPPPSERVEH